jgi:DNA-binding Lrp family transcriptional regulator
MPPLFPPTGIHLTDRHFEILEKLINENGRPLWSIADLVDCDKGNLSRNIKKLENMGVVYHTVEKTSHFPTRNPNTKENRYFIRKYHRYLRVMRAQASRRIDHHKAFLNDRDKDRRHQVLINRLQTFQAWLDVVIEEAYSEPKVDDDYPPAPPRPRSQEELCKFLGFFGR